MKIKFKNTTQLELIFLELSNIYDSTCGKEVESKNVESIDDSDNDAIQSVNSPILMDGDIVFYGKKIFDQICNWSLDNINIDSIIEENLIELNVLKYWLMNKVICPLIEQDKVNELLQLDYPSTIQYIKNLTDLQKIDLSTEIAKHDLSEIKSNEWESTCRKVGIELCIRLGLLRLGRAKIKNSPRVWIGRNELAFSERKVYKSNSDQYFELGENFIKTFIGPRAFDKKWTLSYRGCLWRFTEFFENSKLSTYVEEFESEDVI
jgi:hypothetical protein